MNIAQLQRLRSPVSDTPRGLPTPQSGASGTSFSETLEGAINDVDALQKEADTQVEAFVRGEQENIHEVMLSMEKARTSFQLMVEVRNRMLETYQELMRMQV